MRKIIHIDMDCFFAAVEIRDRPELKDKPVAVGGSPEERGVISTANYVARKFKVHSALSTKEALKRCPELILLPHNFNKYKEVSNQVFHIFASYSDTIEKISIDEAFLDVTTPKQAITTATATAKALREQIFKQTGLNASAGVATNPFLAKIASDWNKPNGQFTITPCMIDAFISKLPIRKIPGVGPKTQEKLFAMDIVTCKDLQQLDKFELYKSFGKWGARLYELSRGNDNRVIGIKRDRKSISIEKTFAKDLSSTQQCLSALKEVYRKLLQRLERYDSIAIKSLFVKIKFSDFSITTIERCNTSHIDEEYLIDLFTKAHKRKSIPVRLLGVGIKIKQKQPSPQLELFSNLYL